MSIDFYKRPIQFSLIAFILWGIFGACKLKIEKDKINIGAINEFSRNNAFQRDIPLNKLGKYDPTYIEIMSLLDSLGFEKIDSGCEIFTIRIINNFDESDKLQVISLKLKDSIWTGKYYKVMKLRNSLNPKAIIDSSFITPKTSWPLLIKNIIASNILTLPNMENLVGFDKVIADGDLCFFEIASQRRYRFFYYYSPYLMNDWDYPECKNVIEIINILKSNIDFKK